MHELIYMLTIIGARELGLMASPVMSTTSGGKGILRPDHRSG